MMRILFQGDSVTDTGRNKEDGTSLGMGYPALVASQLGFDYPNEYEFVNRGINGNRISDLLARLKRDMINEKPDVMSILIGVNDAWWDIVDRTGTREGLFETIYDLLIQELKAAIPDLRIIIMEPFVFKGKATEECFEEIKAEVALRGAAARRIAEKHGLEFIALQEKFHEALQLAPEHYWLRDGVHPTAAGHELIAREWIKQFQQM